MTKKVQTGITAQQVIDIRNEFTGMFSDYETISSKYNLPVEVIKDIIIGAKEYPLRAKVKKRSIKKTINRLDLSA